MKKIVKFPNNYKDYYKKAQDCISDNNFDEAIIFTRKAINLCTNPKEIKKLKLQLCKLYGSINKVSFANETAFEILCQFPESKDVYAILMFNMMATNQSELVEYYFDKGGKYIDELFGVASLKKVFRNENNDLESQFISMKELADNMSKPQSNFVVIDAKSRRKEKMAEGYYLWSINQDKEAIAVFEDIANQKDISKQELSEIYNALAWGYNNEGNDKKSYEYLVKTLEIDETNIDALFLFSDYAKRFDIPALKNKCVKGLIKSNPKEIFDVFKVVALLNDNGYYNEALEIVEKKLIDNPLSFDYNKFKAILLYNKGNEYSFKAIMTYMDRLYGDYTDAKYYLKYVSIFDFNMPMDIDITGRELKKLTVLYESFIESWDRMNDIDFVRKATDREFWDCLNWTLNLPYENKNLTSIIEKLFRLIPDVAKEKLVPKLCKNSSIQKPSKIIIAYNHLINTKKGVVRYVDEDKFGSVKIKELDSTLNTSNELEYAYYLSCALIMFEGQSKINSIYKTVTKLAQKINSVDAKLEDRNCLVALIMALALGDNIQVSSPFIKVNNEILNRYMLILGIKQKDDQLSLSAY